MRFTVLTSQMGYSGLDGRFILEPGDVKLSIGGSSEDTPARGTVTLTGEVDDLEGRRAYLSTAEVILSASTSPSARTKHRAVGSAYPATRTSHSAALTRQVPVSKR